MRNELESFETRFADLHHRLQELVARVPAERLYWQPRETDALFPVNSCGEYVLRSAAAVETTCGGITTRLWDDPFEWTLPESLATPELLAGYLDEVDEVRQRAFGFLVSDDDLRRMIPAPENLRTIFDILLDALIRGEHYYGRACGVFRVFSDEKLSRR